MSEMTASPTGTAVLAQQLQSAEKSIGFIQREHAATLVSLHQEITKWQQKCSGKFDHHYTSHSLYLLLDLSFQLAMNGTVIESTDASKSYDQKRA